MIQRDNNIMYTKICGSIENNTKIKLWSGTKGLYKLWKGTNHK